jgi:hypothetical protein
VELLGRYSKLANWADLFARVRQSRQSGRSDVPTKRGIVRRLSDEQVAELIDRYRAGPPSTTSPGTSRSTVQLPPCTCFDKVSGVVGGQKHCSTGSKSQSRSGPSYSCAAVRCPSRSAIPSTAVVSDNIPLSESKLAAALTDMTVSSGSGC